MGGGRHIGFIYTLGRIIDTAPVVRSPMPPPAPHGDKSKDKGLLRPLVCIIRIHRQSMAAGLGDRLRICYFTALLYQTAAVCAAATAAATVLQLQQEGARCTPRLD